MELFFPRDNRWQKTKGIGNMHYLQEDIYKTGGGTSALISHLQRSHPFQHLNLKKRTSRSSTSTIAVSSTPNEENEESSTCNNAAEESTTCLITSASDDTNKKQASISQMFQSHQKYGKNDQHQKKITNLIVDHVIEDMQPFSLVNSKSFRNLVGYLNPRYTMPDRKTLSKEIIPKRYLQNEFFEKNFNAEEKSGYPKKSGFF